MRLNLMLALAAALALAPAMTREAAAAETTEAAADAARAKARKQKKPVYTKAAEAQKTAEAADQPIMAFLLIEQNPGSDFLEKKVLANKLFKDDLARQNVVLLKLKVKKNAKDPKKLDLKSFKEPERKFLENFGLDEKRAAHAQRDGKELKFDDALNYPAIVGVSPDGTRLLFRMGSYDKDGGMGVWLSNVVDTLRAKNIEPVISPNIQKILDDPMAFSKKK